jgi:hypothetical protein
MYWILSHSVVFAMALTPLTPAAAQSQIELNEEA